MHDVSDSTIMTFDVCEISGVIYTLFFLLSVKHIFFARSIVRTKSYLDHFVVV